MPKHKINKDTIVADASLVDTTSCLFVIEDKLYATLAGNNPQSTGLQVARVVTVYAFVDETKRRRMYIILPFTAKDRKYIEKQLA